MLFSWVESEDGEEREIRGEQSKSTNSVSHSSSRKHCSSLRKIDSANHVYEIKDKERKDMDYKEYLPFLLFLYMLLYFLNCLFHIHSPMCTSSFQKDNGLNPQQYESTECTNIWQKKYGLVLS